MITQLIYRIFPICLYLLLKALLHSRIIRKIIPYLVQKYYSAIILVLGPLLFLIYINDLPHALHFCRPYIFADDTALFYIERYPKALQKRINIDMKLLLKWLKANKILLNLT